MKRPCCLRLISCMFGLLTFGSILSSTGQTLTSVVPARNAVNVPLTASVVFTFDVPIEPATLFATTQGGMFSGSLVWSSNIELNKMSYVWSAGNTVLTCNYSGNLPGSANIQWEINPTTGLVAVKLSDEETFLPVANAKGGFSTVEGDNCNPEGVPDSFGRIFANKFTGHVQTSGSAPTLDPEALPTFTVFVDSPSANAVTAASLQLPNSSTEPLTPLLGQFFLAEEFDTETDMNTAYPAGNYVLTLTRATPPATIVNLAMAANYPPVPQVVNYTQAQSVNAAANFTLQWNPFTGASGTDFISLSIMDGDTTVFEAPDLCIPINLPATATSIVIPAGTLEAGKTYEADLFFGRNFYYSTNSPANFLTSGSLVRDTRFTIKTTGGVTIPQPVLSAPAFLPNGKYGFTASSLQVGTNYRVEFSTTLLPNSWSLLELLTPVSTSLPIVDNGSSTSPGQRFYRIIKQ